MEGNDRETAAKAAVPKTGACSSSATTTQPAAASRLNQLRDVRSILYNKSLLFIC